MASKGIVVGLVGLLVLALVGGSAYILLRPDDGLAAERGSGYSRAGSVGGQQGNGAEGKGQNQGLANEQRAPGLGAGNAGGNGAGNGSAQGRQGVNRSYEDPLADHPSESWMKLTGTVTTVEEGRLVVETDEGSVEVHLGPEWYWEAEGITLEVGDVVQITGFYEGDTFEVAEVENLTGGESVSLRNETGRPLWAGRGNAQRGRTAES